MEPVADARGILGFCRTPVEDHCSISCSLCLGAGIPTAGLAGAGVLPFALRAPGMAAVPLAAGHSMSPLSNSALMTADGHVISPQALQLVCLPWCLHI